MLKGCRYLVLLAAFIVGLGMVAGVEDAEAARVTAVTLSTPSDSGASRGIDSVFVATATVLDLEVPDNLTIVMYLVTTDLAHVVTEGTATGEGAHDGLDGEILGGSGAISMAINAGNVLDETTGLLVDAGNGLKGDDGQDLMIRRADGETGTVDAGLVAITKRMVPEDNDDVGFVGNADSVVSAPTNIGATFTWHGKLDEEVGTVAKVRVAAYVIDSEDGGQADIQSPIVVSPISQDMSLDGDRPGSPGAFVNTLSEEAAPAGFGLPAVRYPYLPVNFLPLLDTLSIYRVKGTKVGPFTYRDANNMAHTVTKEVLGIGDAVELQIRMGTLGEAVLLSDDLTVVADVFGKAFTIDEDDRSGDILNFRLELTEDLFGDGTLDCCAGANDALTDTFEIFYVDKAGNRSDASGLARDERARATVQFLVDTKAPVLDGQVALGDTILPVSTDTITDGTLRNSHPDLTIGYPDDVNAVQWILAEALDTLFITFDGADTDVTIGIPGSLEEEQITEDPALLAGWARTLDFTVFGVGTSLDSFSVASVPSVPSVPGDPPRTILTYKEGDSSVPGADPELTGSRVTYTLAAGITDSSIVTGIHTVKFRGRDFGGNLGPELSRTNVYLDVDDIDLGRLFPSKAAFGPITGTRQDTIEEETSKVIFRLSEPADSVLIVYQGISGPDIDKTRTRRLSGSELTKTDAQQTFQIDSLANGTEYLLAVLARDLAGNFVRSRGDTFLYDTSFVVPLITRFTISAEGKETGLTAAFHRTAGDSTVLTVQADATTDGTREAVTYRSEAILRVVGGTGVSLTGTGVTDAGGGRATLNADDWVTGRRTVTLVDTSSIDTLTVSIVDSTTSGGPFAGALDSVIVYDPGVVSQILVAAPATATQGTDFWVGLTVADKFENTRTFDNRYVTIAANKLGVGVPVGDILLEKGSGGFWANSTGFSGVDLVFTARTLVDADGNFVDGTSASVNVAGSGTTTIDAPDTLIAADYTGADGSGDQGGFVMLTFDNSSSHETLTAYRLWREVSVSYRILHSGGFNNLRSRGARRADGRIRPVGQGGCGAGC